MGDLTKARASCEQALAHDANSERVLERLASICEQAGDRPAADAAREKLAQAGN
jgi:Tfp pilus assembly protein PilF